MKAVAVEHGGGSAPPAVRFAGAVRRPSIATLLPLMVLTSLAFANGGYFPTSWGWSALVLLWIAGLAYVSDAARALGRLDAIFLAGLGLVVAWTFASVLWTADSTSAMLEGERALVYLCGALAVLLVVRRIACASLLTGVWAAITLVSGYALLTRLLPDRLGRFDPVAGYRLAAPIGYWNALGIFAAMGTILALGLAAKPGRVASLAAGSLPILISTLYFTFSRGAVISCVVGVLALIALSPERLRIVTIGLVLAPWPALAVWLESMSRSLTNADVVLTQAARDGHRIALVVAALAFAGAASVLGAGWLGQRIRISPAARLAYAAALLALLLAALVATFVRYGSPQTIVRNAYDAFNAEPSNQGTDLRRHYLSFSGTRRPIQYRMALRDLRAHPLLGSGAGSYEQYWLQHRRQADKVKDAHSLYFETLAELGAVGLALLAATLAVPLVAAVRARGRPLVPAAFGAFVAYALHAGFDWDWEVPAVTLAAVVIGAGLLIAARPAHDDERVLSGRRRVVGLVTVVALGAAAFGGLVGNLALARGAAAARQGDSSRAETWAERAHRWAPWSAQPWRARGEAQLGRGRFAEARSSFSIAIGKDRGDWELWFDLARASTGRAQQDAIAQASKLNPLSPEIAELRREVAAQ